MSPLMFAACLTCLLMGTIAGLAALPQSSSLHFESVKVGQNVTLKCFYQDNHGMILYWYKTTLGQKPQKVSEILKHSRNGSLNDEFRNDPRFDLEYGSGKHHLKISDVKLSDSATYYCVSGKSFELDFLEGAVVHVKGSGLNIQTVVHRSGGSVTLSCMIQTGPCDGEHRVYWFRNSEESHVGLIYTHGGRDDECEITSKRQTCLYNVPLKNPNHSHAGTYLCAVASCGQILFSNGITLNSTEKVDFLVLVYVLSATLAFTVILLVLLAGIAFKMYKRKNFKCKDPPERSSAGLDSSTETSQNAAVLHYAALNEAVRESGSQRNSSCHCVYSTVKQ